MVSFHISPLQVECTMFFQENPYTYETLEGLAVRIGRKPEELGPVLERLVENSILEVIGAGQQAIYRYIQPAFMGIKEGIAWKEI